MFHGMFVLVQGLERSHDDGELWSRFVHRAPKNGRYGDKNGVVFVIKTVCLSGEMACLHRLRTNFGGSRPCQGTVGERRGRGRRKRKEKGVDMPVNHFRNLTIAASISEQPLCR
jgi:hypothetical protein